MPRLFGTDGIRGVANEALTVELAVAVGRAVATACRGGLLASSRRPRVVIGRDPRLSGDMLESALVAGLCSAGADVLRIGMLPTAAVAYLTATMGADAGVMISASHNPVGDNGIKLFGPGGWKLSEVAETQLEALIGAPLELPAGPGVGRAFAVADATVRYVDHLVASVVGGLGGMRVVIDCAHGAACGVAEAALSRAGAVVTALHDEPDGARINLESGATHPEVMAAEAAARGAIGLAFDGDADRLVAADETGRIVDGDQLLAILAAHHGVDGLVVTVMSNEALRQWGRRAGIEIVDVGVGDRNVLEGLRQRELVLGGEQSGHIVRLDAATTGDGIMTALGLLAAVRDSGRRLADLVVFEPMPQVLINVPVANATGIDDPHLRERIAKVEARLAGAGRVLVRASGTEPLVRVMVEAQSADEAHAAASEIADIVRAELGG